MRLSADQLIFIEGKRMSSMEPLHRLIQVNARELSKSEIALLEATVLVQICKEIKDYFKFYYKKYFDLMKLTKEMESLMIDNQYIRFIITDILSTEEYTMSGMAHYTDTPEDIIHDIVVGDNVRPSAVFLERIILLHRSVRPALYNQMMQKVVMSISAEKYSI